MIRKKNSNWKRPDQVPILYCQFDLLTSDTQYQYYLQHNLNVSRVVVDVIDSDNHATLLYTSHRVVDPNAIIVYLPGVCFKRVRIMIRG
jgi:hypothetical protein